MEVIARINIDSPTGRKLVHEIEKHKKVAEIEYPLPEELQNRTASSHNEVWENIWKKLSSHYGVIEFRQMPLQVFNGEGEK